MRQVQANNTILGNMKIKPQVMWKFRESHDGPGTHQSKPGLHCQELFLCVRTTYPITAYNYNTLKSTESPDRLLFLSLWDVDRPKNPPPDQLHAPWL